MQSWGPRILANGPRLVSVLLGALIVEECLRAIVPLLPRQPAPSPSLAANPVRPHRATVVDVRPILAAHLFGTVVEESSDPATAAPSNANLILVGTLATENTRHGIAIIAADGLAKVYQVGDDVSGAALHSVYRDRVVLERGGRLETLALPRERLADASAPHAPPQAARASATRGAPAGSAPETTHKLSEVMHADAAVDDQSKSLLGFRVRPGAGASGLVRAGLRPGDLITAINGTQLVDQDRERSQEAVDAMLASDRASVSILRGGRPLDVSVDLSQ